MPPRTPGVALARCDDPAAGTLTGYRHHMERRKADPTHVSCDACCEAMALSTRRYRKRRILAGATLVRAPSGRNQYKLDGAYIRVNAVGTRRRIQALATLGYSHTQLSEKLGKSWGSVVRNLVGSRTWVYPETAEKVSALYEELSMIPNAPGRYTTYVRNHARKCGWPGPLAWDDEMIDDPYALPVGLNHAQIWRWYTRCATIQERINWVLENGFPKRQ